MAPVGGGGFISGSSIYAKGYSERTRPDGRDGRDGIKVYAAEPEMADDAYRSFHSGKVEVNLPPKPATICDGLRTNLCERTLAIIRKNVDEIYLVSEQEIVAAMRFVWERMKLIIETSSSVPIAALLSGRVPVQGLKVGVMITGGNVDLDRFFFLISD
jgi:threonine dehydratase